VKEHLVGKRPVSEICEAYGLAPSLYYKWQQMLFENGAEAFETKGKLSLLKRESQEKKQLREELEKTQAKLANKHEVLSELMSEHVALKKNLGD
jgi:transposase-like protein